MQLALLGTQVKATFLAEYSVASSRLYVNQWLCMNRGESRQTFETCSKAALLLSLLVSGCGTALVVLSVGTPVPPDRLHLDYVFEVDVMIAILNFGCPIALLSAAALAWFTAQARAFRPFPVGLVAVALVGVFAPALAVWKCLVAIHGESIHLWSRIWWS